VEPGDVIDIIVSHAHRDHMGGIDAEDVAALMRLNTGGRIRSGQDGGRPEQRNSCRART